MSPENSTGDVKLYNGFGLMMEISGLDAMADFSLEVTDSGLDEKYPVSGLLLNPECKTESVSLIGVTCIGFPYICGVPYIGAIYICGVP